MKSNKPAQNPQPQVIPEPRPEVSIAVIKENSEMKPKVVEKASAKIQKDLSRIEQKVSKLDEEAKDKLQALQ